MHKKASFYAVIGLVLIAGSLSYLILFGRGFPYSPIIIGFEKTELEHAILYVQKGAEAGGLDTIDSLPPKVESFHELAFLKKPKIFIFKDDRSYLRRSASKARFCAYYNGNIVISPWALKEAHNNELSLEIYLRHELSHSLLHQHSGILRAFRVPKWLLEGIAVYSADQMGTTWYPSKQEVFSLIRQGNFMPPEHYKSKHEDAVRLVVPHRIPFMYSEFACIVDGLIGRYGRAQFLSYMKELTRDADHDKVFKMIYGIDFSEWMADFRESAMRGQSE